MELLARTNSHPKSSPPSARYHPQNIAAVIAGAGNDTIDARGAGVAEFYAYAGSGNDTVYAPDAVYAYLGGGSGSDVLVGGSGLNVLWAAMVVTN